MAKELLSFSDCGLYFNYFGPDGKLKIWDTSKGLVKQEYVSNLHLKAQCTAARWISTTDNNTTHKNKKRRIEDSGCKILALGITDGSVALYSIAEAKVISVLVGGNSVAITALCWSTELGLFSSSNNEVVWWDIESKKVKRKWKCGKGKITSLAVSPSGEFCVTGSYSLQLWRFDNDRLIHLQTFIGHSSEVTDIVFVDDQYFLSCGFEDRHITIWSTKSVCEDPSGRFSLGECLRGNISVFENNGIVHLCAATKDGFLHYFKHQLNGKVGETIKSHEKIIIPTQNNNINYLPIISARLLSASTACIVYGHPPFFSFESIAFSETKKKLTCLIRSSKYNNKLQDNKRIVGPRDENAEYVGSGTRRRARGEDISMEARLGNLTLGMKVAATEICNPNNLSNLLTQGLDSNDRSLLDSVLLNKNIEVVKETVSKLPVSALHPLTAQLKTMIEGKTLSREVGTMWLKAVLRLHSGQLLASSSTLALLSSILSLTETRSSFLDPFRALSGRLGHITESDSKPNLDVSDEHNVLVYQDEESSDDGSEAANEDNKWEEFEEGMDIS